LFCFLLTLFRCFAHIVNLTSKAMHDRAAIRGDDDYSAVKKLRDAIAHVSLTPFSFLFELKANIVKDSLLVNKAQSLLQTFGGARDSTPAINS
jgi:hypothetical protein